MKANHDTERGGSSLNYQASNNRYTLALVFSLSFPYGTPTILSGYQFSSYDAGSPNSGKRVSCYRNVLHAVAHPAFPCPKDMELAPEARARMAGLAPIAGLVSPVLLASSTPSRVQASTTGSRTPLPRLHSDEVP